MPTFIERLTINYKNKDDLLNGWSEDILDDLELYNIKHNLTDDPRNEFNKL